MINGFKLMFSKIYRHYKINGFLLFITRALDRVFSISRGLFYTLIFDWKNRVVIGVHPRIRGGKNISISSRVTFGDFLWIEAIEDYFGQKFSPEICIGKNVLINDFVHIAATKKVVIGDNALIGSKVLIIDHGHGQYAGSLQSSPLQKPVERNLSDGREVRIGSNVWIGEFVAILPGAKIGDGVIVGAHSTVIGELPENTICVGNPAKPIKVFCAATQEWKSLKNVD